MIRNAIHVIAVAALTTMLVGCSILPDFSPRTTINQQRLERAISHNDQNAHAYYLMGKAELENQEPAAAAKHFAMAMEIAPEFEEAWDGRGIALLDMQKYGSAVEHYGDMVSRFPDSPVALDGLAAAQFGDDDLSGAEENANKALALDPRSAEALRVLGEISYAEGDYAAAVDYWKRASQANPRIAREYEGLIRDLEMYVQKYGGNTGNG